MSYETVEAGLQTQLRAITAFDDAQVSIADYLPLGHGHPHLAILTYLAFSAERISSDQGTIITYTTRIHLYVRYTTDVDSANAMRDRRDDIIMRVLNNPTLGDTAFDSIPRSGRVSEKERVEIGRVSYLYELIDIEIEELVAA